MIQKKKDEEEAALKASMSAAEAEAAAKIEEAAKKVIEDAKNAAAAKGAEGPKTVVWTETQIKEMEKGMVDFPASMDTKERWIAIAAVVVGRNAKQCYMRFRETLAKVKAEKAK